MDGWMDGWMHARPLQPSVYCLAHDDLCIALWHIPHSRALVIGSNVQMKILPRITFVIGSSA